MARYGDMDKDVSNKRHASSDSQDSWTTEFSELKTRIKRTFTNDYKQQGPEENSKYFSWKKILKKNNTLGQQIGSDRAARFITLTLTEWSGVSSHHLSRDVEACHKG
eukprot:GFUD01110197.1.p1 GENE.GFUD01110197.1~~GFUD01110197.1.p1  ORF type:complete len:119 (+),score=21.09 GFUD01110197.1:38-358(+)